MPIQEELHPPVSIDPLSQTVVTQTATPLGIQVFSMQEDPPPLLGRQDRSSPKRTRVSSKSEQEIERRVQVRRMLRMLDVSDNKLRIQQNDEENNDEEEESGLR